MILTFAEFNALNEANITNEGVFDKMSPEEKASYKEYNKAERARNRRRNLPSLAGAGIGLAGGGLAGAGIGALVGKKGNKKESTGVGGILGGAAGYIGGAILGDRYGNRKNYQQSKKDAEEKNANEEEVLESLFIAMYENGGLSESEIVEFLDYILYENGLEFNTGLYNNYFEWLLEYEEMLDEDDNGNIILSDAGIDVLNEGFPAHMATAGGIAGGIDGALKGAGIGGAVGAGYRLLKNKIEKDKLPDKEAKNVKITKGLGKSIAKGLGYGAAAGGVVGGGIGTAVGYGLGHIPQEA